MKAPDLERVLREMSALARRADALAMRSPDFPAHEAGGVVEALTGVRLDWQRAGELGPERAGAVHFAKSIVVLSSMLGARHGLTIDMAGILDDLRAPERARSGDGYDSGPPVLPALPAAVRERLARASHMRRLHPADGGGALRAASVSEPGGQPPSRPQPPTRRRTRLSGALGPGNSADGHQRRPGADGAAPLRLRCPTPAAPISRLVRPRFRPQIPSNFSALANLFRRRWPIFCVGYTRRRVHTHDSTEIWARGWTKSSERKPKPLPCLQTLPEAPRGLRATPLQHHWWPKRAPGGRPRMPPRGNCQSNWIRSAEGRQTPDSWCDARSPAFRLSSSRTNAAAERIGRALREPNGAPAARFGGVPGSHTRQRQNFGAEPRHNPRTARETRAPSKTWHSECAAERSPHPFRTFCASRRMLRPVKATAERGV